MIANKAISKTGPLLFVVSSLATGGSEKKTVMMANSLSAKGHDVHLVYLDVPDELVTMVSNKVSLMKLGRSSRVDRKAVARLRTYIKDNNISTIWMVNLYSMFYGYIATRFLKRGVDLIVSVNTTHFRSRYSRLQMYIYLPMIKRMDCIVFGCLNQMSLWLDSYHLPRARSTVIYNGVDTDYYSEDLSETSHDEARARYDIPASDIVIGMVARFRREKGHVYALEALQQLINEGMPVRLVLVGDGPSRQEIVKRVKDMGLDEAVQFLGNLDDVRNALLAFDIYILTSVAVETFSNSTLEAMAMSKPVVISSISGAPEMVDDGVDGYLFEPGNVEQLIMALRKLMNATSRDVVSKAAREKVCRKFSVQRMVCEYERVLGF